MAIFAHIHIPVRAFLLGPAAPPSAISVSCAPFCEVTCSVYKGPVCPSLTPAAHQVCLLAHPPCWLTLLSGVEEEAEEAATKLYFLRTQEGPRGDTLPSSVSSYNWQMLP